MTLPLPLLLTRNLMTDYYENGMLVRAVDPVFPGEDDDAADDILRVQRETVLRLTRWLSESGSVEDAGRRVMTLASVLHLPGAAPTVRALAHTLGLSKSQAHRMRDKMRHISPMLTRDP